MTMCKICGRVASQEDFCRYHDKAWINLRTAFEGWNRATGADWEVYLDKLLQIEETGRWVIDVIEYFRQQDGSVEGM